MVLVPVERSLETSILILLLTISFTHGIRVAIVGGGIGGTSTAYFLSQSKLNLEIHLYDPGSIGGRLAVYYYNDGVAYETGGSIIHSKNLFMNYFVKKFGLEKRNKCPEDFGIFRGKELLYQSSAFDFLTFLEMWWRYGNDMFRFDGYVSDMLASFSKIYGLYNNASYPVTYPSQLLENVDPKLLEYLKNSTRNGLKKLGFSDMFVNEVVSSIIRCNYCQSLDVHLFVGSVALAGAGADLWSVKYGNWKIAEELLKASGAKYYRERVYNISAATESGEILVMTRFNNRLYDYVVIATPIFNDISFYGFPGEKSFNEDYHHTHCTLLKGEINATFFNMKLNEIPKTLIFTSPFKVNAMSRIHPVDGDCAYNKEMWKIFSDSELNEEDLNEMFKHHEVQYTRDWLAYPNYYSASKNRSFYLFEDCNKVLYVNAIETVASAMEMSAIGAHNVASLIVKSLGSPLLDNISLLLHDEL